MTTPATSKTNFRHPIYRNTNNFILFVNFILFCTVPLISCESGGKGNGVDASGELRKQLISSHNIEHSNSEWKSEKAENEELHPQLFAAYHESYITKAAAKDFRKKIRTHKKPITEKDYNDLLQDIVLKPIEKPKDDIYEKKYFDYLPAEDEIDFDAEGDNNDYRFAFDGTTNDSDDLNGYDEFSDEENDNLSETMIHKNRFKRDIKDDTDRLIQNEKRHAGTPSSTTRRPPPSLIHNSDSENSLDIARPARIPPLGSNRQGGSGFIVGPSVGAPIWSGGDGQTQSNRPISNQRPQQIDTPVAQLGPSRCVWGIVNCCSRQDISIRYACFERIGCQGAFWDLNPCGDDILDAALNEADQYFN